MRARGKFGPAVVGLAALALLLGGAGSARAGIMTVDYTTLGTFQAPTLDVGGVKVTGSNTINVSTVFVGLGIVGGLSDATVDFTGGESITFTFDAGAATAVQLFNSNVGGSGTANAQIAAFGAGGGPLGTHTVDLFHTPIVNTLDVSALFGNVPISSFTITPLNTNVGAVGTDFTVQNLSFTPAATTPAVPEPSTFALLALGGGALAGWRRWRKGKA